MSSASLGCHIDTTASYQPIHVSLAKQLYLKGHCLRILPTMPRSSSQLASACGRAGRENLFAPGQRLRSAYQLGGRYLPECNGHDWKGLAVLFEQLQRSSKSGHSTIPQISTSSKAQWPLCPAQTAAQALPEKQSRKQAWQAPSLEEGREAPVQARPAASPCHCPCGKDRGGESRTGFALKENQKRK